MRRSGAWVRIRGGEMSTGGTLPSVSGAESLISTRSLDRTEGAETRVLHMPIFFTQKAHCCPQDSTRGLHAHTIHLGVMTAIHCFSWLFSDSQPYPQAMSSDLQTQGPKRTVDNFWYKATTTHGLPTNLPPSRNLLRSHTPAIMPGAHRPTAC